MKKFVSIAILCICTLFTTASFADNAAADDVSIPLLKEWASEKYGCKIDSDGDLILNTTNGKTIVSVIKKAKLVRICSIYTPYEKRTRREMIDLANKFNAQKRFLRIAIGEKNQQFCDYYVVYNGGLNSTNFMEVLDWFVNLEKSWNSFVVNNGAEE